MSRTAILIVLKDLVNKHQKELGYFAKVLKGMIHLATTEEKIKILSGLQLAQRLGINYTPEMIESTLKSFKRNSERISLMNISIAEENKEVKTFTAPVAMGMSRTMRGAITVNDFTVCTGLRSYNLIGKNFTNDFTLIHFEDSANNAQKNMGDKGIIISYDKCKAYVFVPDGRTYTLTTNVADKVNFTEDEIYADFENPIHYRAVSFTASGTRGMDILYMKTSRDHHTSMIERVKQLNDTTNYAFDLMEEMISHLPAGEQMMAILKNMNRFGQVQTSSVNHGAIPSWVYEEGKFQIEDINTGELEDTADGTVLISAEFIAYLVLKNTGKLINPKLLVGRFFQIRPDLLKVGAYAIEQEMMDFKVKAYKKQKGLACCSFRQIGSRSGKLSPVMIADKNAVKGESDWDTTDINFELLDIAQSSKAYSSGQMIMKFLPEDASGEFKAKLVDIATKEIVNSFDLSNDTKGIPTKGAVVNAYAPNLLQSLNPTRIREYSSIHDTVLKNIIKGNLRDINKMRYPVFGSNDRLISDMADVILSRRGCSELRDGELIHPKLEEIWRKNATKTLKGMATAEGITDPEEIKKYVNKNLAKVQLLEVIMIKYPSMGMKEYYHGVVVPREYILHRVKKKVLNGYYTSEEGRFMSMYYKGVKAPAMLPACKRVMDACAGLDYDYDNALFVVVGDAGSVKFKSEIKLEMTKIVRD